MNAWKLIEHPTIGEHHDNILYLNQSFHEVNIHWYALNIVMHRCVLFRMKNELNLSPNILFTSRLKATELAHV